MRAWINADLNELSWWPRPQTLTRCLSIRKLSPTEDDNFALNDIDSLSKFLDPIFNGMNIGGWAIAALSLIVGMFGVANITKVDFLDKLDLI